MEAEVSPEGAKALCDILRAHVQVAPDVLLQLRPSPTNTPELLLSSVSPGATACLVSSLELSGSPLSTTSRTATISAECLLAAVRGPCTGLRVRPMARGVPYVLVRAELPGVARVAKVQAADAPLVRAAHPPLDSYPAAAEVWPEAVEDALSRLGGGKRASSVLLSLGPDALSVSRAARGALAARAVLSHADVVSWVGTGRLEMAALVSRAPLAAAARLAASRGVSLRIGVPSSTSGAPVLLEFGSAGVRVHLCLVAGSLVSPPEDDDECPPSDTEVPPSLDV